jgi:hypothetical protein
LVPRNPRHSEVLTGVGVHDTLPVHVVQQWQTPQVKAGAEMTASKIILIILAVGVFYLLQRRSRRYMDRYTQRLQQKIEHPLDQDRDKGREFELQKSAGPETLRDWSNRPAAKDPTQPDRDAATEGSVTEPPTAPADKDAT